MDTQLTSGAIAEVFSGNDVELPILQLCAFKIIDAGDHVMIRLLISDGKYRSASSKIAGQLMVEKDLTKFAVFRVERYVVNTYGNTDNEVKQEMILLDITVLVPGDEVGCNIGSPVSYDYLNLDVSVTYQHDAQSYQNFTKNLTEIEDTMAAVFTPHSFALPDWSLRSWRALSNMSTAGRILTPVLKEVFSGNDVEFPVLQVLGFKVIYIGNQVKHRLLISDGKYRSPYSMIATQLNDMVGKDLTKFAVFRVDRYVVNTVHEVKKEMILLDITVLVPGDAVGCPIGSPVSYEYLNLDVSVTDPQSA